LKSAHQVPNNGILEEVTRGSMTIVAKQSLAVAIRFISDWSRNLEVVLVAIFSSTVTAAVLQFILGWSRNLEVVPTKTTRLYGEVVTTIRSISTLSSEKEMHMGSFSLHSMVPLHLIFGMLVD
jgi:hypothetical protein